MVAVLRHLRFQFLPRVVKQGASQFRWNSSFADEARKKKIPISVLSGFLGSGKTTLLQELLQNKGGLKVGVVVNDVASVNIDAKLVRDRSSSGIRTKSGKGIEFVELENGCACCNSSDELMACIDQLLEISKVGGYSFDRIVIEMSGVAEPKNVRREIQLAMREDHPIFDHAELSTMITVVDSPHFFELYSSKHDIVDHQELIGLNDANAAAESMSLVERKVVDLLVEQVECADLIVLNKDDRVDDQKRLALKNIVSALNPKADIVHCEYGKIALDRVFLSERGRIATLDDDDDIREAVESAKHASEASHAGHSHGHSHSHEHTHAHEHEHAPNAAEKYGISTFVYSRRRPFHPKKLQGKNFRLPLLADVALSNRSHLLHACQERTEVLPTRSPHCAEDRDN
eukprot:749592-Hanusia_phi.AAC.2